MLTSREDNHGAPQGSNDLPKPWRSGADLTTHPSLGETALRAYLGKAIGATMDKHGHDNLSERTRQKKPTGQSTRKMNK